MNIYRYSDKTLEGMTKKQLIRYVRMCEHNQDVAEESLAQQYENIKDWQPVVHAKWEALASVKNPTWFKCSRCGREIHIGYIENLSDYPYCHCGAKMDKED